MAVTAAILSPRPRMALAVRLSTAAPTNWSRRSTMALGHRERRQGRVTEDDQLDDGSVGPDVARGELGGHTAEVLVEARIFVDRHPREEALLLALGLAPQSAFLGRRRERSSPGVDGWDAGGARDGDQTDQQRPHRSEEHTSELQSHVNLVCRLLL